MKICFCQTTNKQTSPQLKTYSPCNLQHDQMFPKVACCTYLVTQPAKIKWITYTFIIVKYHENNRSIWANLLVTSLPILTFYKVHQFVVYSCPMRKEEPTSWAEIHKRLSWAIMITTTKPRISIRTIPEWVTKEKVLLCTQQSMVIFLCFFQIMQVFLHKRLMFGKKVSYWYIYKHQFHHLDTGLPSMH